MKQVKLNLGEIKNKEQLHEYLKNQLGFPEYYGKNLDALNDCLGEMPEDVRIELVGTESFLEQFGEYGETVMKIFCTHI